MDDAQQLADRHVAVWNETDDERRRQAIAELWVPEGEHYVELREVRGYAGLEKRIIESHVKWVRDGGFRFRAAKDARGLHDVVTFHWEMVPKDGGEVAASGLEFLAVDKQDRILVDYQFPL
ncbi:hypothetical protein [Mesorhizobium sp. B2-7-1]|uniref:hypothetical protein n=1 Tax=Mesorhizobium sp. B2-7-1 TaxID=2589909 RepID=UPI00112B6ACC|nr:hypothetical protein [Mesorhizobium sp. B2-7-1]TPJ66257.1 hypothetical protein FJ471_14075 [Mesorhizobium sp. B2-7-1]